MPFTVHHDPDAPVPHTLTWRDNAGQETTRPLLPDDFSRLHDPEVQVADIDKIVREVLGFPANPRSPWGG